MYGESLAAVLLDRTLRRDPTRSRRSVSSTLVLLGVHLGDEVVVHDVFLSSCTTFVAEAGPLTSDERPNFVRRATSDVA